MADEMRFGDLPDDVKRDALSRLDDLIAADREHSHVSSDTFQAISRIVDEEMAAAGAVPADVLAQRIARELSPKQLGGAWVAGADQAAAPREGEANSGRPSGGPARAVCITACGGGHRRPAPAVRASARPR